MKIRTKFTTIFLALSLVPIALIGSLAYSHGKKMIERSIGSSSLELAREIVDKLDRDIYGVYLDSHTWSHLALMQGVFMRDIDSRISSFLIGLHREYKYFSSINVMDEQGKVVASSNPEMKEVDFSDKELFRAPISGRIYTRDIHFDDEARAWVFTFSFPIQSESDRTKVMGVLSVNVKADEIKAITQARRKDGEGRYYGKIIILRGDGLLIAGPKEEDINVLKANLIREGLKSAKYAAQRKEGYLVERFHGTDYLIGYEYSRGYSALPGFGWIILVAQDAKKVFMPVERLKVIVLGAALFVSLCVVAISFFIARKMSGPITEMSRAAEKVARGDFREMVTRGSRDEIGHLVKVFNKMIHDLRDQRSKLVDKEELEHNYNIQHVVNSLLRLSLEDISLNEYLNRSLDLILSVPWFSTIPRGAIFLAEDDSNALTMRVERGLAPELLDVCAKVPFGRCLCGRAALEKKVQFADRVDERHQVRYEGIAPHGHYCAPIVSTRNVIGVINLYLKEGYVYDKRDEDFLSAVSNALAAGIERKRAEDELKKAYLQLKNTQNQLIQSEKLAALGRLSAGVAHEVKNPLAIITGGIELIEMNLASGEIKDVKGDIYKIKLAIARADAIVKELLRFARPSEMEIEKADPRQMVNDTISLLRYKTPLGNIELKTEFANEELLVKVDKNQMQQVIMNILSNSIDAMPKGGSIVIRTYRTALAENKPACAIEVKDAGEGIPEESLSQLFEPFFTTKRDRKGTGLGLSISRTIVKNHKGDIDIVSVPGKGTEVKIVLPLA